MTEIPGSTYGTAPSPTCLVVEPTRPNDGGILVWVGAPSDGPGYSLSAKQARTLAADLTRRADVIDPPAGGRS